MQDRLADVMAAIDHPEAIDRMNHVIVGQSLQTVGPRQEGVLHLTVPGAEEEGLRRTGGPAGRVHNHAASPFGTSMPWKSPYGGSASTLVIRSDFEKHDNFGRSSMPLMSPGSIQLPQ